MAPKNAQMAARLMALQKGKQKRRKKKGGGPSTQAGGLLQKMVAQAMAKGG